jgi:glycerol-3-phosphate dehydrogenase
VTIGGGGTSAGMWTRGWRDAIWKDLERASPAYDVIIIGGGITGAGILAEASRAGMRALLVEAKDFASGTSSRSTKLVHGGLRYLRQAQIRLTRESVRERERLLREAAGLVMPLGFYLTSFKADSMPTWMLGAGLAIYDVLGAKWAHERHRPESLVKNEPSLKGAPLKGGYHYYDAQTDDARLVVRVLREAVRRGGTAINYARVEDLLRDARGAVCGVVLRDTAGERTVEVQARAVVNATGVWADGMRVKLGEKPRIRAIRGSHLVFPAARFPLGEAISLMHPRDGRAVFAIPWEGITLLGTTDVDHGKDLETEPAMSAREAEYLMEAAHLAFPSLSLDLGDVRSSYAGVRGVIDTGASDPSKESREHALWSEKGLLTVTGGKLTTFRLMAREALDALESTVPRSNGSRESDDSNERRSRTVRILDDAPTIDDARLDEATRLRLAGRHGIEASDVMACDGGSDSAASAERIGDTPALWSELRWAARSEGVVHLEDLLLRRVRLGVLLGDATFALMDRIRKIAQPELGWDDARWEREERAYREVWKRAYGNQF